MSLQIGIVGLPNVGKSTLFRALTKKQVDCANYPFCTIEPNVGVVEVPDPRLRKLAEVSKSEKIVPAAVEFVDIAGLVRGASAGEGLGNQFLAHIREVHAIAEVLRVFEDPNITHVHLKIDPREDAEVIGLELALADLRKIERRYDEVIGKSKSGDKEAIRDEAVLRKVKDALGAGKWAREVMADADEKEIVRDLHLLTMKPTLFVLNDDEKFSHAGNYPELLPQIIVSAKIESELAELPREEANQMMADLGMKQSGLDQLIVAGYKLLDLITFFTSGPKETRAWTIRRGTLAPQAAGVIHSDFEKGFIRAEVIKWEDFVKYGEAGSRERGLLRTEGRNYIIQDGDVCHFRIN